MCFCIVLTDTEAFSVDCLYLKPMTPLNARRVAENGTRGTIGDEQPVSQLIRVQVE